MKFTTAIQGFNIARISEGYAPETLKNYTIHLNQVCEYLQNPQVESVTTNDLRLWFYHLRTSYIPNRSSGNTEPLTETAIHSKWKALRSFFSWAAGELSIPNIAREIPAPKYTTKAIIPFTQSEIKSMLAACEYTAAAQTGKRKAYQQRRPTALRDKTLVMLLLDTGLRIGEVSRLRRNDLDITGQLVIRPMGRGLKTAGRSVYVGKACMRQLWRYLTTHESEYIFCDMSLGAMKEVIQYLGDRTHIHAHPHKFRHTFAIEYLRNGGDVFTLQRLLGHKSLEMVNKYLTIVRADIESAHRRASPVDNWRL
jgi:integrase/recombinase XerD